MPEFYIEYFKQQITFYRTTYRQAIPQYIEPDRHRATPQVQSHILKRDLAKMPPDIFCILDSPPFVIAIITHVVLYR